MKFTSTHGIYAKFNPGHYSNDRENEVHTKLDHYKKDEKEAVIDTKNQQQPLNYDMKDPAIEYKLRDQGRNYGGVVGNTTKDSKFTHDFQENNNMIQGQINRSYPHDKIDNDHDYSKDDQNDLHRGSISSITSMNDEMYNPKSGN